LGRGGKLHRYIIQGKAAHLSFIPYSRVDRISQLWNFAVHGRIPDFLAGPLLMKSIIRSSKVQKKNHKSLVKAKFVCLKPFVAQLQHTLRERAKFSGFTSTSLAKSTLKSHPQTTQSTFSSKQQDQKIN